MAYRYYQEEVILAVDVSADQTDFPVLLNRTLPGLRTVGNGGRVESLSGFDIVVSPNNDGTARYDHEVEFWDATTGEWIVDFRMPALSSVVNNVFYIAYGDATVVTSQEDIIGVWDAFYKMVWHLNQADNAQVMDSTSNNHDSTSNTTDSADPAIVYRGINGDGTERASFADQADFWPAAGDYTIEGWMRTGTDAKAIMSDVNVAGTEFTWYLFCGAHVADKLSFSCQDGAAGAAVWSTTSITDNVWRYFAARIDGGSLFMRINAVDEDGPAALAGAVLDRATFWSLAGHGERVANDWVGDLDEVRLSKGIARDNDWLTDSYNNQDDPTTFVGLVGGEVDRLPPAPPAEPGGQYILGVHRRLRRKTRFAGRG